MSANILADQEMRLPSLVEVIEEFKLSKSVQQMTGIVEPTHKIMGLMTAASVHAPDGQQIILRFLNTTDEDIIIRKGTVIGRYLAAEVVEQQESTSNIEINLCQQNTTTILPDFLEQHYENWCTNLANQEKKELRSLLASYQDVFSKDEFDMGRTFIVQHEIPLMEGTQPLKHKPYQYGPNQEK